MDSNNLSPPERPRKRRAINACVNCRSSKVRCDGIRPSCQRCLRNNAHCQYYDAVKDPNTLRIETLEAEVFNLRAGLDELRSRANPVPRIASPQTIVSTQSTAVSLGTHKSGSAGTSTGHSFTSVVPLLSTNPHLRYANVMTTPNTPCNAVDKGMITWEQASAWFQSFFSGSQYLVPIFCETHDTFESVLARSAFLFDAIISIGCRAEEGINSPMYHRLQSRVREHLTSVLINPINAPSLESIQAIAIMASYSENGFVSIAIALRFALEIGLPDSVDQLLTIKSNRMQGTTEEEKGLYRISRVWYGICNLELFFSLDGGKLPGITLDTSIRKIRALVSHPERTGIDVRLLSQVELNIIRCNAYRAIMACSSASILNDNEGLIRKILSDTTIELGLWIEEWAGIVSTDAAAHQRSSALINLHIQYEWAIITLHLKALSDSGIENIALMNEFQRDMVRTAKEAAVRHLQYIVQASTPPSPAASEDGDAPSQGLSQQSPTYLTTFRWTMDYVWAKCAFSVLLVLKLALLLRDPPSTLMLLLRDAHKVLEELKKITVGHIAYFHILQVSIEKCEGALKEYVMQQPTATAIGQGLNDEEGEMNSAGQAEKDFERYVPSEFVFEWDFPGLNLKHVPLGWQDLFIDLDTVF